MDTFTAVAKKHASSFGKVTDALNRAAVSQTEIWLRLAAAAERGKTADEHYAMLPDQYTSRITSKSFGVTWSVARKVIVEINKRELDIAEIAQRGSLNSIRDFLFPKPVVDPAVDKGGKGKGKDAAAVPSSESKTADVVVLTDKALSLVSLIDAAGQLPTDKLEALYAQIGEILAARGVKAA